MRHSFLDHYADRDSVIHRRDARVKSVATLALLVGIVVTPGYRPVAAGAYAVVLIALMAAARLPVRHCLGRVGMALPFILGVSMLIPFFKAGQPVWTWGPVRISAEGVRTFGSVMSRAVLSVMGLVVLISTTRFARLLEALRWFRVPGVFVMILAFLYRYLFALVDEAERMVRARVARGGRLWGWQAVTASAGIAGRLFIRTYERGERIYASMCARGFDGEIRTPEPSRVGRADVGFLMAVLAVVAAIEIASATVLRG